MSREMLEFCSLSLLKCWAVREKKPISEPEIMAEKNNKTSNTSSAINTEKEKGFTKVSRSTSGILPRRLKKPGSSNDC
jgi:hypothetical protein